MQKFILIEAVKNTQHSIEISHIVRVSALLDTEYNKSKIVLIDKTELYSIESVAALHTKILRAQRQK